MRLSRLVGKCFEIVVCGKVVKESKCEKILGILVNNKLSWWNHIYGDSSDVKNPLPGLISQLSKRVGMLSRLVYFVPPHRFKMLVHGIFMSKLNYCIRLYGTVSGMDTLEDTETRQNSFTKASLRSLQVLQNKVLHLLTGHGYETPVLQLLQESNILSVNQLIAYNTIITVFKINQSSEPLYIAERLGLGIYHQDRQTQRRRFDINIDFRLARGREGNLYQSAKLWNALPISIRTEFSISKFKQKSKSWVKTNIPAIPK